MDHAIWRSIPPKFLRVERAFQEVDQGFCPARMEVGLNIGRAFPLVVLALVSRDVPVVAGFVSNGAGALPIFLISHFVDQRSASCDSLGCHGIGIFYINVKSILLERARKVLARDAP